MHWKEVKNKKKGMTQFEFNYKRFKAILFYKSDQVGWFVKCKGLFKVKRLGSLFLDSALHEAQELIRKELLEIVENLSIEALEIKNVKD